MQERKERVPRTIEGHSKACRLGIGLGGLFAVVYSSG